MTRLSVVTDSTSYLPADVIERHGIHVVPLYVVFGGDRTVPETDITDYDAFFEELRSSKRVAVFRDFLLEKVAAHPIW